jgi:eukaryotic-like serine/threonine-protein kinase
MKMQESLKLLFAKALEQPAEGRAAFLSRACAGNPALRARIERLLSAHVSGSAFLASPTGGPLGGSQGVVARPGVVIGSYTLLRQIGEGGFGAVFMAEQSKPVSRRVALKIIKAGMDTQQVIARFEAERQALALMDHPAIARVFDGGTTEAGRPYFVMELVTGEPITAWCDRKALDIRVRLGLFQQVCRAVQHAHQKGIIHRDLKPSNILVAEVDGRPVPKIIDFGIAKAVGGHAQLTDKSYFTDFRQFIGTPEYMSPEQAGLDTVDVDTRSDIYSLGVLLYELLTGTPPLEPKRLRSAMWEEMRRMIREEDPPRPSTRLSTLEGLPRIAGDRGTEAARLPRLLRADLDWITMKCLEKDRSRRYETANALAADLGRHLAGEPVVAAPPSRAYRVRKFMRRNRPVVLVGSLLAGALVLGTTVASTGLVWALREAERAMAAEAEAMQHAQDLELVIAFQASQLSDIDTARMGERIRAGIIEQRLASLRGAGLGETGTEQRLRELDLALYGVNFTDIALAALDANIFERALTVIDMGFADHPLIRARLLQTLADTMLRLGLLERALAPQAEALEIRRRHLGNEDPDTLTSASSMGILLWSQTRLEEAGIYLREALEARRRVLGTHHPDTIASINNLGALLRRQGKVSEAELHYRQALDAYRRVLGDEHPDTLVAINNLGMLLKHRGELTEAEIYLGEALEARRRVLGDEDPDTLGSVHNMAVLMEYQDRLEEAERYYREALEGRRRVLGNEHLDTLESLNDMGIFMWSQERLSEAEGCFREAMETRRRKFGDDHPSTLNSINSMGVLLRSQGKLNAAAELGERAAQTARRAMPHRWETGEVLGQYARTLAAMERFAEAEEHALEAHAILEAALPAGHARRVSAVELLVDLNELWHAAEPSAGHDAKVAQWRAQKQSMISAAPADAEPPKPSAQAPLATGGDDGQ